VVYIVVFVQLTTTISEYFWFILLVVRTLPPSLIPSASLFLSLLTSSCSSLPLPRQIPAFAGYKLLGLVFGGVRAAPPPPLPGALAAGS
jgi:hypothetical protein